MQSSGKDFGEFIPLFVLQVLNISGNSDITELPPEMGLLSRLWNLNTRACSLQEPLKSMIDSKKYKTMDVIGYLKVQGDHSTFFALRDKTSHFCYRFSGSFCPDLLLIVYCLCSSYTEYTRGCKTICPHEADDCWSAGHWQDVPPGAAQARGDWVIQEEAS